MSLDLTKANPRFKLPIAIQGGIIECVMRGGHKLIADEIDLPIVKRFTWQPLKAKTGKIYAYHVGTENGERPVYLLHRLLAGATDEQYVDHRNHNTLDNRRINLRICSSSQNNANRIPDMGTFSGGLKGVSRYKHTSRWRARIHVNKEEIALGVFDNKLDAARAYDEAAKRYFGEFAFLNFGGLNVA